MSLPPLTGLVRYGSFVFPDDQTETVAFELRPRPDAAGRSVVYNEYKITLRTILAVTVPPVGPPAPNIVPSLSSIRTQLTTPAQEFHYFNRGMDVELNVQPGGPFPGGNATSALDAAWGPWPEIVSLKFISGNTNTGCQAAELTWTVTARVACENGPYKGGIIEWCWKLTLAEDKSGYLTRTHSGFYRIAVTRMPFNSSTLPDTADAYRERINVPLLAGFRRLGGGTFTLSEDKARCDYTIVDEEMPPNFPPIGAVEVSAAHTLHSLEKTVTKRWSGSINATYEMARDWARSTAYVRFWALAQDRLARLRRGGGSAVILRKFTASEPEIYGRKCASFTLQYTYAAKLKDAIGGSGLWTPVPGNSWEDWKTSLEDSAIHLRGNAKYRFLTSNDAIINLCGNSKPPQTDPHDQLKPPTRKPGNPPKIENPKPDPSRSWLLFQSFVWIEQIDDTVPLKPLPQAPVPVLEGFITEAEGFGQATQSQQIPPTATGGRAATGSSRAAGAGAGGRAGAGTDDVIVQVRGKPLFYAHLVGFAARAGYPITPPVLTSVGGAKAVPFNSPHEGHGFKQGVIQNWLGLPIYGCVWHFRYLLRKAPVGDIPVMETPGPPG